MSGLPSLRSVLLVAAAVAVMTALGGGVAVLLGGDPHDAARQPVRRAQLGERQQIRLDQLVPTTAPARNDAEPAAGGPGVTVTPPSMIAIARGEVPKSARLALAKVRNVQKVVVVDAGAVQVAGTSLNLLAVEPAAFRSWTPKAVAEHPGVWGALARGELVADAAATRRLGLVLGAEYQVDGGPRLRVAASAALGLRGVDGLVSAGRGQELRMARGVAVLLHGKGGAISQARVRRLLGAGSQVVSLVPEKAREKKKPQAPATAATAAPTAPARGRPASYLDLYKQSATRCPGLSWTVLAAIGQVESSHGRNNGPSSAGALGPMQFMPATWKVYGVDGDADGKADIWSPYDAVPGAANYLCANGAGKGGEKLRKAIWFYNHSWDYVNKVMGVAEGYARAYT
ncbi:lytic transglycosylase domain-containing protein [Nonomuraea sp. 3-1Str]|uniref:lytic transglycosylase domain-containing protein n=2 Tax=unclassified Nonomuraea TaxID=2593643 RepID=UPI002867457E|nr:lytic transglycosylase domain-containing protein [Nonomuraea sp. 3-1Str]MDR8410938.1 lytic transglycosylase domain-containing protein [Nonomuraea sp. 3-1Str]